MYPQTACMAAYCLGSTRAYPGVVDQSDMSNISASRDIVRLIEIMAALRTPGTGCPWDLAQDFSTIAPYTIEEAYEVADAIERGALVELEGELGDLLFQIVFHARMAEEAGLFDFGDVVAAICDKLVRRHPHVFGDEQERVASVDDQTRRWEEIKREERDAGGATRRQIAREHGRANQYDTDSGERQRISRCDAEEQRRHESRQRAGAREADHHSGDRQCEPSPNHQSLHRFGRGAKRNANPELARLLRDRE